MERYNAIQIRLNDNQWDNADLITLLYKITTPKDVVFNEVPELKLDDIFFIETDNIIKDLFRYEGCFEWINGTVKLWHSDIHVTKENYRTKVYDIEPTEENEGEYHYTYTNWYHMTPTPPKPLENE